MSYSKVAGLTAVVLSAGLLLTGCGDESSAGASGSHQTDIQNSSAGDTAVSPDADETDADTTDESSVVRSRGSAEEGWTLLIYLCGSDLESENGMATYNLEEMCSVELPDNVDVIVETGGANSWETGEVDPDVIGRYRITDGALEEVDEQPTASMGESSTLTDFLSWGMTSYPNAHTGVILWDHGGGNAEGVCYDELYDYDNLTMEELGEAVNAAPGNLDFIGFDACLMASLETAKAVENAGYYMVASEETEPGYGWDYTALLSAVSSDPSISGDALGQVVCDSFLEKCGQMDCDDQATLSVVDLSAVRALDEAFDVYTGGMALAAEDVSTLSSVAGGADKAESYGGNTDEEGYCNMVDIADLVLNTRDYLDDDGSSLLSAVDNAVIYEVHGDSRENSNGLSVFYPLDGSAEELETYAETSDNTPYLQYMAAVTDSYDSIDWTQAWEEYASALETEDYSGESDDYDSDEYDYGEYETAEAQDTTDGAQNNSGTIAEAIQGLQSSLENLQPVTSDDFDIAFEQYLDDDGYLNLTVTSGMDAVKSVHFLLWYEVDGSEDSDATEYVYLGEDNDLNGDWDEGIFKDNFFGTWMTIGGEVVNSNLIEETDSYNLYSIPAQVNGEDTNLRAVYNRESGTYRVLGRYDGMDSGVDSASVTSRGIQPLEDGDEVVFYLPSLNTETGEEAAYYTDTVVWDSGVVMEDSDLGDAFFLYMYEIRDIYGTEYDSDPVEMQAEGDNIIPYEE